MLRSLRAHVRDRQIVRIERDHAKSLAQRRTIALTAEALKWQSLCIAPGGFRTYSPKLQIGVAVPRKRLDSATPW